MLNPGRHQIELDGVVQAYEVTGEGPVCFAHSGGPGVDSDNLRMPLVEQHLTMVYLDPIGTGESGLLPGGDYSVAEYARRLELLRAHLGVTDGFLLGHSHGGFVALKHALDYPGRMRGLIIYDSAPTWSRDLLDEARWRLTVMADRWADRPEVVAGVRAFLASDDGEGDDVHDAPSLQEHFAKIRPLYFADYRRTVNELGGPPKINISVYDPDRKPYEWDARCQLGAITVPALILVGTYDFICPPVWARQMRAEMPNSRVVEFADSGHFLHVEEPGKFRDSVREFVAEVNRAR
jgi:proline iminopeptidase